MTGAVAKPSGKKAKRAKIAKDGEGRAIDGADKGNPGFSSGMRGAVKAAPGQPLGLGHGAAKKGGKESRPQSTSGERERKKKK